MRPVQLTLNVELICVSSCEINIKLAAAFYLCQFDTDACLASLALMQVVIRLCGVDPKCKFITLGSFAQYKQTIDSACCLMESLLPGR